MTVHASPVVDVVGTLNAGSLFVVDDMVCYNLADGQSLENYLVVYDADNIVDSVPVLGSEPVVVHVGIV